MSGGVDSSLAAALIAEQGGTAIGVTLRLCPAGVGAGDGCLADGIAAARRVCEQLGIVHFVLDRQSEFVERVLRPSWDEYACGRTPNPCAWCNERVKFALLLDFAKAIDASRIATGHYARLEPNGSGGVSLRRGVERRKDQSYFLFALTAEQRRAALFPLGELTKEQTRKMAKARGLASAERPDSQDACFVAEGQSFPEALRGLFGAEARAGEIADAGGRVVGAHGGLHQYTIGQRQGLGVALGKPAWVKQIDAGTGRIVLTSEADELLATDLIAADMRWQEEPRAMACEAQIRYRHAPAAARVEPLADGRARVRFDEPQRAITPGQAVVLYDGDALLGGGWIERSGG
jgi:tRNA-specific 2-thiouridylase